MRVVITDSEGNAKRTVYCPESEVQVQANPGEVAHINPPGLNHATDRIDPETGEILVNVKSPPAPSHLELRGAAYPSIQDQLDALWKGGAEAEAMRQTIMDIKARYPKDETGTSTP